MESCDSAVSPRAGDFIISEITLTRHRVPCHQENPGETVPISFERPTPERNPMVTGKLFVISAPSGAGKSTLISRIRPEFPNMLYSISCTTRMPRQGESNGVDYHFISRDQFRSMIDRDDFLEWKEVHGNLYGTPAGPVREAVSRGRRIILDIDVQGAKEVFAKVHNAVGIFISAVSMKVLEHRLRMRGTDSEESIRTRLLNAETEMKMAGMFTYHVVNDELERAVQELTDIIRKESSLEKT
jgi:guanylate kinase